MTRDLIVIATTPGRQEWVREALASISRPCIVVSGWGYELGKIAWVLDNTTADRFLFLQDSMVIRDESFFDLAFEAPGSCCLSCQGGCLNGYVGLYERSVLERVGIPRVESKQDSIAFETQWTEEYISQCMQFDHPVDSEFIEIKTILKFGRENLVRVNQFFEKWYGTWDPSQIADHDPKDIFLKGKENDQSLALSRLNLALSRENAALRKSLKERLLEAIRAIRA